MVNGASPPWYETWYSAERHGNGSGNGGSGGAATAGTTCVHHCNHSAITPITMQVSSHSASPPPSPPTPYFTDWHKTVNYTFRVNSDSVTYPPKKYEKRERERETFFSLEAYLRGIAIDWDWQQIGSVAAPPPPATAATCKWSLNDCSKWVANVWKYKSRIWERESFLSLRRLVMQSERHPVCQHSALTLECTFNEHNHPSIWSINQSEYESQERKLLTDVSNQLAAPLVFNLNAVSFNSLNVEKIFEYDFIKIRFLSLSLYQLNRDLSEKSFFAKTFFLFFNDFLFWAVH